jgi:DUF438 domain-containing protein
MSEYINNREHRQKALKEIILELHQGKTSAEVKAKFESLIKGVSAAEIAEMEQALIKEGMKASEIQKLCDVHASVFKGSIEEIHREQKPEEIPGHPVHTFKAENREIEKHIKERVEPLLKRLKAYDKEGIKGLLSELNELLVIDRHYSRKENLLFPYLEKHGITAPPKVMWGVDDEIRAAFKTAISLSETETAEVITAKAEEAVKKALEMIFKEESILYPMALEALSEEEWLHIRNDSNEIGYCFVEPGRQWKPLKEEAEREINTQTEAASVTGQIDFNPGLLTPEEIKFIFNTLPVDITFVDKTGAVKYFSQTKDRVFVRPPSIIGRQVSNCHPPASVHIVEKIVEDLKSGKKDNEDFWIRVGGRYVYIRYYAVRDDKGDFLGVMEVTQDIGPLQEITGEKRLMSE